VSEIIDFEGHALTTLTYQDRPVFIAREVGALLEYAHSGGRLVDKITGDWSDEFIDSRDFIRLEGEALADFKALTGELPTESVGSRTRHLLLLTESGMDLVCIKTSKEVGKRLRRFIVDHVLPKLRRGIPVEPQKAPPAAAAKAPQVAAAEDPRAVRERRLEKRENRLGADRLVAWASDLLQRGRITEEQYQEIIGRAAALVTGERVVPLLPVQTEEWYDATETARRIGDGITHSMVGRIANALGIKGDDALTKKVMAKHAHNDGQTTDHWLYSAAGIDRIRVAWTERRDRERAEEDEKARRRAEREAKREQRKALPAPVDPTAPAPPKKAEEDAG
jgi:prophage antirepressor-like protein